MQTITYTFTPTTEGVVYIVIRDRSASDFHEIEIKECMAHDLTQDQIDTYGEFGVNLTEQENKISEQENKINNRNN